jgi:GGDEF domain-containing protein
MPSPSAGSGRLAAHSIERPDRPHGPPVVRVMASMGWAFSPRDGRDPQELLVAADRAMYAAKRMKPVAVSSALPLVTGAWRS